MITLSYGDLSVTLRNPQFGDQYSSVPPRIYRPSRRGTLNVGSTTGVNIGTTNYTITALTAEQKADLLLFCIAVLGKEVTLVDFDGMIRTVLITNTPQFAQNARECYMWDVTLEMEEVL